MKKYKFRIKERITNLGRTQYFPQVKRFLWWEYIHFYTYLKEVETTIWSHLDGKDSLKEANEIINAFKKRKTIKITYHKVD